jgi:hypothetical protein
VRVRTRNGGVTPPDITPPAPLCAPAPSNGIASHPPGTRGERRVNEPCFPAPVLFLDERTTGLDPQGRTELWAFIEELVDGGTTLLLTTQYLEEADRLAERIVVIDHGAVIAEGTPNDLKGRLGSTCGCRKLVRPRDLRR